MDISYDKLDYIRRKINQIRYGRVIININSEANELEIITEENPKKENSKEKIIEKNAIRHDGL